MRRPFFAICYRAARFALFSLLAYILTFAANDRAYAASSYVRVSLVGYESGLSGSAYLMTTSSVSSETFKIVNAGGTTVASGKVGATSGEWGSFNIYPITFTISKPGTYTLSVSGSVSATSPKFAIDMPVNLYSDALANTLSFYQNERDGADYIPSALRNGAGHLNDANAKVYKTPSFDSNDNIEGSLNATRATIDASGGWWDAGDYLKFVQTHSYVVALMLAGIRGRVEDWRGIPKVQPSCCSPFPLGVSQ